ncbi:glycosyltransferase family 9 protein [Microbacterium sp. BG28]|uniref:glycosyltransferase family 9 protein n=1 Tax=Microbacterium sp. BG28 TaxID=3097356 RepID=UPI002A5A3F0E|nr:glycosyltransferase family 9 protein [Microbacterium sp. BG28]MDY0830344.1 glycosyltransferase family 9 protein [Microbacterium sp. BG28]
MRPHNLLRRIVWTANAIRHRDPLSPRLFLRLFGSLRRRPWDSSKTPRRVAILRSDEIGDTATTLALLAAMRLQWPKAVIHLVVKPGPATMFHAASTVDRVIEWTPITEGSAPKRQILTARQALRRFRLRGYDLAVLPRWDFDDTPVRYLAAASRARSVVGFAPVPDREPVWFGDQSQLLTDEIERGEVPLLTVDQLRRVAAHLGLAWPEHHEQAIGYELFDDADARRVTEMAPLPANPGLVIAVGIGARDAKRQWPVEDVAEAVSSLAEHGPTTVQILGGAVDAQRAARLSELLRERDIPFVELAGGLTLSESAAAIARSDLFLGNDSGLQHIASAIDLPVIVVTCHPASGSPWSDNAPERFGPWSARSVVLQPATPISDCTEECVAGEAHCIRQVRPAEVVAAITGLLQSAAS